MSRMLMLGLDDRRKAILGILRDGSDVGTLDEAGLTQRERFWEGKWPLCLDSGDRRTAHTQR